MTGLKDFINFLFPIPPVVMMRQGDFPNCIETFDHIKMMPNKSKWIGKLFIRLSRLTGFAWMFWAISAVCFFLAILIVLYNWGYNIEMTKPVCLGVLTCKMIIAMLAAILVVSKLIYTGMAIWSLQLAERCCEEENP